MDFDDFFRNRSAYTSPEINMFKMCAAGGSAFAGGNRAHFEHVDFGGAGWLAGWPIAGWLLQLAGDGCGSRGEGGFSAAAPRRCRTTNLRRSQELGQHRENPIRLSLFGELCFLINI